MVTAVSASGSLNTVSFSEVFSRREREREKLTTTPETDRERLAASLFHWEADW